MTQHPGTPPPKSDKQNLRQYLGDGALGLVEVLTGFEPGPRRTIAY
jgi:hypothetical protein